jgi:nucleotide-binding universal stress UspA family protein
VEKLLRAFIRQKGGKLELIHNLEKLASAAEALGLPPIPRLMLNAIQCPAGVRYGDPGVTLLEAMDAHHAALAICSASRISSF